MIRWAAFDPDRVYRYRLTRTWAKPLPTVAWIMLNPSTADEHDDDPTISRVVGFSRKWGYGSAHVVNLFALRATSPTHLRQVDDPVGPANDVVLAEVLDNATTVIAAWGNQGAIRNPRTGKPRCDEMWRLLHDVGVEAGCLSITRRGQPAHPLYLPGDTQPTSIHSAARPGEENGTANLAQELSRRGSHQSRALPGAVSLRDPR